MYTYVELVDIADSIALKDLRFDADTLIHIAEPID